MSHVAVYAYGGSIVEYGLMPFCYYESSDTESGRQHGTTLAVGDVVMYARKDNRGVGWDNASSIDYARGVVITADNNQYVVQKSGLLLCARVGITEFQKGDYVGITNGKLAIVQSASDAVGRVIYVQGTKGFIEFNWR